MFTRRAVLALAVFSALSPSRAAAESGFSLGFDAKTIISQDLKLLNNPTFKNIRTNNVTNATTIQGGDYFQEGDNNTVDLTSTTYTRSWDKLEWNADLLYIKGSYVNEYFEAAFKMGAARAHVVGKETTNSVLTPLNGSARTVNAGLSDTIFLTLPQDFSYGFEIKGAPYQTENFLVLTGIHFRSLLNKRTSSSSSSVNTSTASLGVSSNFDQEQTTFDAINYGLDVLLALKMDHFHPFLGLSYADGKLKVSKTTANSNDVYNAAGVKTKSVTTIRELNYIMLPKAKTALVLGFTLPFETGGINFEARIQGESSIAVGGFVVF